MEFELTEEEGGFLVGLARTSIEAALGSSEKVTLDGVSEKLRIPCGVFVTLNKVEGSSHSLRGCIGFPYPVKPLADAVAEVAVSAALRDPRFSPVSKAEMDSIVIEVSVLTPPELLSVERPDQYPSLIEIGRDGLIVARGQNRGLLLPQVPVEWGWDAEEFLTQCCLKARLQPDAWLLPGTEISRFRAIIFSEDEPREEVKRVELRGG
ncbi:TIGR00296 family protein [Candidatus Bathyarchaeota archaeon]|nr:MAG: TIGR00296 family protein [Candidatus Bathyarchaeota archaeon]